VADTTATRRDWDAIVVGLGAIGSGAAYWLSRSLGEGVLGYGELHDRHDLVPVDGVQTCSRPGLGEGRRLRGQPQKTGGLGVHRDGFGSAVPGPQSRREGGQDVPHSGRGLTSAH
jgi:hypothetical protein